MELFKRRKDEPEAFDITFYPRDLEAQRIAPKPKPAKAYMPDWLKKIPNSFIDGTGMESFDTAKHCMPFLDSFTNGYIQELPCDLTIKTEGRFVDRQGIERDAVRYKWSGSMQPMGTRRENFDAPNYFPKYDGFYDAEFHWFSMWEPKTPPGYSTLYTHPHNRSDLPFFTWSGIIDTDKWPLTGPLPFLIKEGFEGIIPAGTPMYQMTFIRRAEWTANFSEYDPDYQKPLEYSVRSRAKDGYKKLYWNPKRFYSSE